MSEPSQMDKTFQTILKRMIETGQAPHYTEIASELDMPLEEARRNRVVIMLTDAELAKLHRLAERKDLPLGTAAYEIVARALGRQR